MPKRSEAKPTVSDRLGPVDDRSPDRPTVPGGRVSVQQLRELFEESRDAIVITARDGTILSVNRAGVELFGWDRTELSKVKFQQLYVDPEEGKRFIREIDRLGSVQDYQVRLKGKNAKVMDCLMTATAKRDGEGAVIGYHGIIRNITARKLAEDRLRESEERFRLLSENAPDIIYTLGLDGAFTYVNPAWTRLLGHRIDEVIGRYFIDFVEPGEEKYYIELFKMIRDERKTLRFREGRLIAKDGQVRHFTLSGAPNLDPDGNVIGIVGLFRDVTERRKAETEAERHRLYLERFFDIAPEAIAVLDPDDRVMKINNEFTRLFGYTLEEVRGHRINDLIVPEEDKAFGLELTNRVARGEKVEAEAKRRRKDGTLVDVSILGAPVVIDGEQVGVYGIYRDITERKKAEEALKESEERHRTVLEASPDPVVVYDTEGRVTYVNPAFTRVFGWTLEERAGLRMDFVPEENWPETEAMIEKVLRGETLTGVETRRLTKTGRVVDVSISGASFFDQQGRPQGSVVTIQDITRRKRTEAQLKRIAYSDMLTGLPNRKSFYKDLEESVIQSRRRGDRRLWALLFMDLDRFKDINDTLGHDVGDGLLKEVAGRIQDCLRKSDYIYRLGGDEFTVIANDLGKDIDAARVAQKILDTVSQPIYVNGHKLFITASIGISVFPDDGDDVEVMVKNADMAMYAAKEERNGYRFYTAEMNQRALERMKLESTLRQAVHQKQLVLHYQPLVNNDRRILGMEALVRWNHPELGLLLPDQFIPLAEETGAILVIGEWVIREACRQAKKWHDMGYDWLYVSINLSPRQLGQPNLVDIIERILAETGLPPSCLKLEMTESGVADKAEQAASQMRRLHDMGVRFAIDDFGTGYSSLGHLKRFPVDTLKIDRSFIRDATSNPDDREIIKTIISMAKNMGMETVAEGVETEEQNEFLCTEGCYLMQGFLFGHPIPEDEFERLLEESAPAGDASPQEGETDHPPVKSED